jgi:hypothetical protein
MARSGRVHQLVEFRKVDVGQADVSGRDVLLAGGQDVAAAAVQQVVTVLHGDDRGDLAGLGKVVTGDAAKPQPRRRSAGRRGRFP